jgi:hypothetical protein
MLGQHQPVPGGLEVAAAQQPTVERRDLLAGGLLLGDGLLAGLLSLAGPLGRQPQLPRAVRRTRGPQFGEPVAFGAQSAVDSRRTSGRSGTSLARVLLPSRVSTRASSSSGARASLAGWGRSSSGPSGSGPTVRYRPVRSLLLVSCT